MRSSPTIVTAAKARAFVRPIALGTAALFVSFFVLLSCVGEPTAPQKETGQIARGLSFNPVFPAGLSQFGARDQFTFDRVHVLLRRVDGSVALDTLVNFPATASEVSITLDIRLLPGTPPTGETLTLEVQYLNVNEMIFRGATSIVAVPTVPGQPAPPPVSIPDVNLVYTGPGSAATAVRISPRTLSVVTGAPFAFTAVATDASGTVIPNTPIAWASLDPTRATITASTAGTGVALNQRGTARIVAQLVGRQMDTVTLTILPVPTAIVGVSGSAQTGIVGKPVAVPLPQPLVVRVTAADGQGVAGTAVTFAAGSGGAVSPTSATTDANGLAQATWTLGNIAGAQTATATASGLTGSPVTFTATAQQTVATKLAFTTAPAASSPVSAGLPIGLAVAVQDAAGDPVVGYTGPVALTLSGGALVSALAGTTTVNAVAGVATFSNVSIAAPGTGYIISASAPGLTGASTAAFDVVSGPAANILVVAGGGQTAAASAALAPITVLLTDASGNAKVNAEVTFAVSSGGGSVTPTIVFTDAQGRATVAWTLGASLGLQTMSVSSPNVTTLSVSATATSSVNHWVVTVQPGVTHVAGTAITPGIVAELRDASNALVATYNGNAVISLTSNISGATLLGTTSVSAVNGVATFSNVVLNKAFQGYTLNIDATNVVGATTSAFDVTAAAAATLGILSGNNQSGQPSTALPQPVVGKVTDGFGNGVDGVQVTFTVTSGGGTLSSASATTSGGGLASTLWTLGASGTQSMQVASTGMTGSPSAVSATFGSGPLATTTVTPQRDSLFSFNETRNLSVQGRDAGNNIVSGSWTWVSRNPSVATVNAAGAVTSVADGSTYVVATEAGGTRDSALIVVQQRIAGVNVSPPTRSIYTSGNFTFTALAVDGRNVAMTTQPIFTWSSTVPSVATVNATTGVATGVTIGSTQIRATSGSTVGVSNLTVLTPITQIDVTFDSTNASAPDNFTMTSLGDRRMYRAIARDTLLNPMTGITFTWTSTNASVAIIDSTTPTKARATAAANGITSIQASAQGVTGSATLNVAQVLSSIELTPLTTTVGVAGTTSMLARGKDANNRYISGGSFTYASSTPTVATINATTGVVTGVANGTTNITATSGAITSNTAIVSVNNSGPAVITFGRDTIGVGRGSSLSVPVLLSKPHANAVTVNLSVADTIAFWSSASVTIPAGQTSANATLNGRNAGTSRLFAQDGSGTGYAGDTAVVAVQANLRMTLTNYSMTATDQISTQVLLSDPSPAGGTYVTFSYSVAGRAQTSPDPAFIPAGQLAADVVIRGLTAGSTTITPSATGVSGTAASVNIAAANLSLSHTLVRIGDGQYENNTRVFASSTRFTALNVTLTSTDTTLVTVPPTVVIPANSNQVFFHTSGRGRGTAQVVASAPGWAPDTFSVQVTTPKVRVTGGGTLNVTSPQTNVSIYSADSLLSIHIRTSSLAVRMSSSDTTVIRVLDTLVTIAADNSVNHTGRVVPGGAGGTAYVKVSAGGHTADSVLFTVIGPKLSIFNYTLRRLGAGQQETNDRITIPNAIGQPLVVTLTSSDSNAVGTPATVTIPANNTSVFFTSRGKVPGSATLIATATGYAPDTATTIVTTPRIRLSGGQTIQGYATSSTTVSAQDSTFTSHARTTALVITLRSSDTTVLKVDSTITIAAGASSASPSAQVIAVNPGTARIIVTAPGHLPDSTTWTVQAEKLRLYSYYWGQDFSTFRIGARQHHQPSDFVVFTPTARNVPVTVTLTQKQPTVVGLSTTTPTVPPNQNSASFTYAGLTTGQDTIIASAPGYLPDTGFVIVTTPKFDVQNLPSALNTTDPGQILYVYMSDSLNTNRYHYTSDTIVVRAVSTDSNVIRPAQQYFRIPKDAYYGQTNVSIVGVGSARIIVSDSAGLYRPDSTNIVTVTGPALNVVGGAQRLGMRQRTSQFDYRVVTPNAVTSPLVVNLLSTDTRVATVPSSVTIPVGQTTAYFIITAQDTLGTIQIQATAVGYAADATNMQVTAPRFVVFTNSTVNTTSPRTAITVRAADSFGSTHEVNENVTVTLTSSAPGVASIDSTTVTIQAGSTQNTNARLIPGAVGTAHIAASDARTTFYKYVTGADTVTVVTPQTTPQFNGLTLGIGQYADVNFYIPDLATSTLTVPIGHSASPRTNTPGSTTIPVNTQFGFFRIVGTSVGNDTLTMSPPGHVPGTAVVSVALGRIDALSGWPATVRAGDSVQVTLVTKDQNGNARQVAAATTFSLSSNTSVQFVSGGGTSIVITSVVVPADGNQVSFWVKGVSAGTGSANITNVNYTPYSNTVSVTP